MSEINKEIASLSSALRYAECDNISGWLQEFLRGSGDNIIFADGLLLEERRYIGPVKADITRFGVSEIPEYLTTDDDICWFNNISDVMIKSYNSGWDMPPLIVNFSEGVYEISDGRHRYAALRRMGVKEAYIILWTTGKRDYELLIATDFYKSINQYV